MTINTRPFKFIDYLPEVFHPADSRSNFLTQFLNAFEQDTGCINVLDFDLTPDGSIGRTMIKSLNLTPYNWLKHGMNLTSLEAIFERNATEELR